MVISLIVAMTRNRVIGLNNAMPWHLPADLQHFKTITLGKPIVMGRKTFEAIGKALPGRQNIIVSHNPHYSAAGCTIVTSLQAAIAQAQPAEEVMVIGGAQIFKQAMPLADRMYITWIETTLNGDAYFPEWDAFDWQIVSVRDRSADEKNAYALQFVVMEKYPRL